MHWLTWREIWAFLKSYQGAAVAVAGLLATLYYGPRKVFETWDWYLERIGRDRCVLEIVLQPKFKLISMQNGHPYYDSQVKVPHTVTEIASRVNRREASVTKSLRRLERLGRVKQVHGGWM